MNRYIDLNDEGNRYYLSIVRQGGAFVGVGITEAESAEEALSNIRGVLIEDLEILAIPVPDEEWCKVPEDKKDVLLTKDQVKEIWNDAKSIREYRMELS